MSLSVPCQRVEGHPYVDGKYGYRIEQKCAVNPDGLKWEGED